MCWGITIHRAADADSCPCLEWNKAYGPGGIDCQAPAMWLFSSGFGGLDGQGFCNFATRFNSNACILQTFKAITNESDSVCWVDGKCAGAQSKYIMKTCSSTSDTLLKDMSPQGQSELARKNSVDPSVVAGYGAVYVDMHARDVNEDWLKYFKAKNQTVYVWSGSDTAAARLLVKGDEVYEHTYNTTSPMHWNINPYKGRDANSCPCISWSKAYGPGGVGCSTPLLFDLARTLGGLNGQEFCSFVTRFDSNVCLTSDFMHSDAHTDSVCWVEPECAGQPSYMKICSSTSDTLLKDMPIHDVADLARKNKVDPGVMAAYGALYIDKAADDVTDDDVKEYQAQNQTSFLIYDNHDHMAPRMHIRGKEVYFLNYAPMSRMHWTITCKEGCEEDLPVLEDLPVVESIDE
jgi:hypothetical protein